MTLDLDAIFKQLDEIKPIEALITIDGFTHLTRRLTLADVRRLDTAPKRLADLQALLRDLFPPEGAPPCLSASLEGLDTEHQHRLQLRVAGLYQAVVAVCVEEHGLAKKLQRCQAMIARQVSQAGKATGEASTADGPTERSAPAPGR